MKAKMRWAVILILFGVCLLGGVLFSLRPGPGLKVFQSQDAGFKIKFPRQPTAKTNIVDGQNVQVFFDKDDDGFFMVQAIKKSNEWIESEEQFKRYFYDWVKDLIRAGGEKGELKKEKFYHFANKHPSVDCDLVMVAGRLSRMRVIHAKEMAYNITAAGSNSWPGWEKSTQFFDSFQLLD